MKIRRRHFIIILFYSNGSQGYLKPTIQASEAKVNVMQ